jgi:hypothetical protein
VRKEEEQAVSISDKKTPIIRHKNSKESNPDSDSKGYEQA